MGKLIPNARPQMSREDAEKIIATYNIDREKYPVCVVAVRGYFRDSLGEPGKNDRGIYDDAAFVCTPNLFSAVNWNTDASRVRMGSGKGAAKGMAMLDTGVWDYQIGKHKKIYPAGVQAGQVRVLRDGNPPYQDIGFFGINHHPGSSVGTSSLGCQTAPPEQFASYIQPIVAELARYKKQVYKYILIEEVNRKTILEGHDKRKNTATESQAAAPKPTATVVMEQADVRPARDMRAAVEIIKEFEGFFSHAYRDPVGIWTIGWGTIRYPSGQAVKDGDVCTKESATVWLSYEMKEKAGGIESLVKVPLNDNEFCALTSFAYNCGVPAFKGSGLLRKLNAGVPRKEVSDEFLKWVYAGGRVLNGLVRRRKEERELFLHATGASIA